MNVTSGRIDPAPARHTQLEECSPFFQEAVDMTVMKTRKRERELTIIGCST